MAQIIINIPDGIGSRVNNLLAKRWQYQETITNPVEPFDQIPNPESKADFNKRKLVEYAKSEAVEQETIDAGKTAEVSQRATSESELDITSV